MSKDRVIRIIDTVIEYGLMLLLGLSPLAYGLIEVWSQALVQILILFLFLFWLVKLNIKGTLHLYRSPLDLPIIIFIILAIFSATLFSIYSHASTMALYRIISFGLLFYVIFNNVKSERKIKNISSFLIILGGMLSFLGILRYFNCPIFNFLWRYAKFSTYTNTSHFTGYIGMVLLLSLALLLSDIKISKKMLFLCMIILMFMAELFSLDKGGWFQLLGGVLFLLFIAMAKGHLKLKGLLIVALVVIVIWSLAIFGFEHISAQLEGAFNLNIAHSGQAKIRQRAAIWKDTVKIIKDYPLMGTGIGTFSYIYPRYRSPEVMALISYAHQDFLQLAQEMGLLGLAVFIWFILSFFKLAFRFNKDKKPNYLQGLAMGGMCACFGLLIHSLYDFNLHIPANAILFITLISLSLSSLRLLQAESVSDKIESIVFRKMNIAPKFLINIISLIFLVGFGLCIVKSYRAYLTYEKALFWETQMQLTGAVRGYEDALRLEPNNTLYLDGLADLYVTKAKFSSRDEKLFSMAERLYKKAISLCTFDGSQYLRLANLYALLGDKIQADKEYRKAIFYDPNNTFYRKTYDFFLTGQDE